MSFPFHVILSSSLYVIDAPPPARRERGKEACEEEEGEGGLRPQRIHGVRAEAEARPTGGQGATAWPACSGVALTLRRRHDREEADSVGRRETTDTDEGKDATATMEMRTPE